MYEEPEILSNLNEVPASHTDLMDTTISDSVMEQGVETTSSTHKLLQITPEEDSKFIIMDEGVYTDDKDEDINKEDKNKQKEIDNNVDKDKGKDDKNGDENEAEDVDDTFEDDNENEDRDKNNNEDEDDKMVSDDTPGENEDEELTIDINKMKLDFRTFLEDNNSEMEENTVKTVVPQPPIVPRKSFKSILKRKRSYENNADVPNKKIKENVTFGDVTVYYFPRTQGFSSVPSDGDIALGMEATHSHMNTMPVNKVRETKRSFGPKYLSAAKRRKMLLDTGVSNIDTKTIMNTLYIRYSRKVCGCECEDGCSSECSCFNGEVPCQNDSGHQPCGCNRKNCRNKYGHYRFNSKNVRNHYDRTFDRITDEDNSE
ncbi:myb-like protein X isoform X2 [Aethina tumida]|uniref:myb-like protein X isoform X2 n=1 Tax=Aethina tumida TaxID=116153 RepID=UPI0021480F19|nr:myb-like protein X isoform X2 [Aethina tumida]